MGIIKKTSPVSLCKFVFAMVAIALLAVSPASAQNGHWLTGYYAIYDLNGVMNPGEIDYTKLTHVIYWGVFPNTDGSLNTTVYVPALGFSSGAQEIVSGAHAAGAKALIGIGGDFADGFSAGFNGATTPANLPTFVNNIVALMQQYGFDGVDINWEQIGYYAGDNTQFPAFIAALRTKLNTLNPRPLLTMSPETYENGGRPDLIGPIYQDFDQINIQTYQMSFTYCGWETWYNSPLSSEGDTFALDPSEPLPSIDEAIKDYTTTYASIPESKLGIGIQFAGVVWKGGSGTSTGGVTEPFQTWTGDDNCNTSDPDAPSENTINYSQVVPMITAAGYTENFDETADQNWLSYTGATSAKDEFVSYESPQSIAKKGSDLSDGAGLGGNLGGAMMFELSGDFLPAAAVGQQHPLLNAARLMQSLLPGAVTGLNASVTQTSATLTWTAAPFATSYDIYKDTGGAISGTPISTTTNQVVISDLSADTTYTYSVVPVDAFAISSGGAMNCTFTTMGSTVPTGLTARGWVDAVTVQWNAVTSSTGYVLRRSTTSGSGYTQIWSGDATDYTDNNVVAGKTYYYVVEAKGSWGTSGESTQASATPFGPLSAPTGLVAKVSLGEVSLSWNAVTNAISYAVERKTATTEYTVLKSTTATSYNDIEDFNGTVTYYYVVYAQAGTAASPLSNQASATPTSPVPAAPGTPKATGGPNQVALTWTAVPYAAAYYVYRNTTDSGYTKINTSAPVTTPTYTDTKAYSGLTYYYVVKAVNAVGTSKNSPLCSATPTIPAPANLTDTIANSEVTLKWSAVAGVVGYEALRSTVKGGPYGTEVGTVNAPTVTITDSTAIPGTTYYYVVEAYYFVAGQSKPATFSPLSSPVSATVAATKPAAPTGLAAYLGQGGGSVNLGWTRVVGAASYSILRSTTSGSGYKAIGTSEVADYTDLTVIGPATYYYVVEAVNTAGSSGYSNQASITVPKLNIPESPGVQTTVNNGVLAVETFGSEGATDYQYYRSSTMSGTYKLLGAVDAAEYIDTSATPGVTYYYEMTASNAAGTSAFSSPASGEIPPTPTGLRATGAAGQIDLTWTAVAGASGYTVLRGTSSTNLNYVAGSPTTNSLDDTSVTAGTTYYYEVQTIGADGISTSAFSTVVSASSNG